MYEAYSCFPAVEERCSSRAFSEASVATDARAARAIFRGGLSKSAYLLNAVLSVQGVGNGCVREAGASSGIDRVKEWSNGNFRLAAALCTTGSIFFAKTPR